MKTASNDVAVSERRDWVPETAFGKWFISTNTWIKYVLSKAILDLRRLAGDGTVGARRLMDVGCGRGLAFPLLVQSFAPQALIGLDIDEVQLAHARAAAAGCGRPVELARGSVTRMDLADGSVDVIFCHQLIHHVANQAGALRELHRVLADGGVLLLSESCAPFIRSWWVRAFFRHPDGVQKTARQYVELVRAQGFGVAEHEVEGSRPWWSLADFGLARRLGLVRDGSEPTEVLIVARKAARP